MFICVQDWTVETINQDLFQFMEGKNPTQETKQKTNILRLTRPTRSRKRRALGGGKDAVLGLRTSSLSPFHGPIVLNSAGTRSSNIVRIRSLLCGMPVGGSPKAQQQPLNCRPHLPKEATSTKAESLLSVCGKS